LPQIGKPFKEKEKLPAYGSILSTEARKFTSSSFLRWGGERGARKLR